LSQHPTHPCNSSAQHHYQHQHDADDDADLLSCNAVRDQILLGRRGTRQITKSHLGKYCSTLSFSLLRAISLGSANIVQQPLVITRWSLLPLPPDPNIVPLLCYIYLAWRLHFYQILSPIPLAPPPSQPGKCHTYEPAESYLK